MLNDSEILTLLSRSASASISIYDTNLVYVFVNSSFARLHGLTPDQIVGKRITDVAPPENIPFAMPHIERALGGESVSYERKVSNDNGFTGWRIISLVPWFNQQGKVVGVINCGLSVHELKSATEELRAANQRLKSHLENSPLAVIEFDVELTITYASTRAKKMFGPAVEVGLSIKKLLGTENRGRNKLLAAFSRLQESQENSNRVETVSVGDGAIRIHREWFNSAITDAGGNVVSIMSLVQDISDRIQLSEQMRLLAERDSLTGLLNNSAFRVQAERALLQRSEVRGMSAVLFIDLDGFKAVNDTLGHSSGDLVLREVGCRISSVVRNGDLVARIGGDEFSVLLEDASPLSVIEEICQRIISAICEPFDLGSTNFNGIKPQVNASIGVAQCISAGYKIDHLLKLADAAMYAAKNAGKGCIRYA
jgi:diguanylate cyclase (GGDEF)-like protein/PAS domain S-box-containing protein